MKLLPFLLVVLAAQFLSPSASAQATCADNGAGEPGCASVGYPINVITGNKFLREVDLAPLPGLMGLEIVRYYNSSLSGLNSRTGILGRGWRLSYETTIAAIGDTVQVLQADGTRLIFARDLLRPSLCSSSDPANGEIDVRRTAKGDEYVWRKRDGQRLSFNHQGRLVQILAPTGEFTSMQHDARGWLVRVTDPQGRSLRIDYLDKKQAAGGTRFAGVQGIDSPLGRFTYGYGSAMPKGARSEDRRQLLANLVDVRMPDGALRHYHYEDGAFPTLLTGTSVGRIGDDSKALLRRYTSYGYDGNGDAVRSTRAGGIGAVGLDGATGGKTILTNSVGQQTEYRYGLAAGQFRLQEVRGAGCATCSPANVRYGYDELGRLTETSQLDARGAPTETIRKELDWLGRVTRVSRIIYRDGKPGPAVMQARYEYDRSGGQPVLLSRPSVVAGKEAQTRTRYNGAGQALAVTDTGWAPGIGGRQPVRIERTTHYRYTMIDGRSVLAQADGPLANGRTATPSDSDITEFGYAPRGQANGLSGLVSRVTAPGGRTTLILARNAAGLPTRIRTADAIELSFDHDSLGRVVRRTSGGISEQLSYDELGQLASVRRATGQTVFYAYSADGRVSDIYDQQNNRIKLIRNSEGELIARHLLNPDGSIAQRADAMDFDDPQESAHVIRREAAGAGPAGAGDGSATLARQADGIAATLQGPGTVTAHFKVDHAGRLTNYTDARGLESKHIHDDFGRLVGVVSPDSGITVFDYDAADRLASRTSAFGSNAATTVAYRYDSAGRAIEQRTAEGLTTIRYGAAGKPERIAYPGGEERYSYDPMGRLLAHFRILDGHALVTRYSYDANGNLSEKTLPDGQVLLYTYHGPMHPRAGLLSGIARRDLFGKTVLLEGLNDAEDGFARQRYRLAHGVEYWRELDVDGRITRIGSPGIWEERQHRSTTGQLLSRRGSNANTAYAYDAGGRLIGVGHGSRAMNRIGYAYDNASNLQARVSAADRMRFQIDATRNRIDSARSGSEANIGS